MIKVSASDYLNDRLFDIDGRVVADIGFDALGEFAFDFLEFGAHGFDHVDGVAVGQHVHADEDRLLAGEAHFGVIVVAAEFDFGDVFNPHDGVTLIQDRELLEFFDGTDVSVGS